ncbi:MAG: hypothetical protein QMD09_14405, partial [Desulfatibacillaceae bacterium]|nr:hypothetical protein [Desulfatibacillaceae bacterium]
MSFEGRRGFLSLPPAAQSPLPEGFSKAQKSYTPGTGVAAGFCEMLMSKNVCFGQNDCYTGQTCGPSYYIHSIPDWRYDDKVEFDI